MRGVRAPRTRAAALPGLARGCRPRCSRSAPSPRTRWAWDCAYPQPYSADVRNVAPPPDGVDVALVYGVMRQESAFNRRHRLAGQRLRPPPAHPRHRRPSSPRPRASSRTTPTRRTSSIPPLNVRLGTRYLRDLVARFDGQLPLAAAAYNAGEDAVDRWKTRGQNLDVDTFVERIPYAETRTYVDQGDGQRGPLRLPRPRRHRRAGGQAGPRMTQLTRSGRQMQ